MSEEMRAMDSFSPMRSMTPFRGGASFPVQGTQPQGFPAGEGMPLEQESAFEPLFTTASSMQAPGAPEQTLPRIMQLLRDPAQHNQFCQEFRNYMSQVCPDQKLMNTGTEQGFKMPSGGRMPSLSGLGQAFNTQNTQGAQNWNSGGIDDLNLSGSIDDRISQLTSSLQNLESRKSELEGQVQQLQSEIEQLQSELHELESQKRDLETQKHQKQQEANQARQEQNKLQSQKSQLKNNESQLNGQKQSLTSQSQALGGQITQLTAQIASVRASAASLHSQAAVMLTNPYTAAAGAAMEAQAAALDAQAAAMEVQKQQLQVQKQQTDCQIQQVTAQLQQNTSQLAQVEQQLTTSNGKVQQLENEVAQIDQKLQQMEQKVSESRNRLNEKKKDLADKKAELAQIKVRIAHVKQKKQEHEAFKNYQNQYGQSGQNTPGQGNAAGFGNPLSMLGILGMGKPPGSLDATAMINSFASPNGFASPGESLSPGGLASPGGIINMSAQKPDGSLQVAQFGMGANRQQVAQMLEEASAKYGVPSDIMKSVAWNDSSFNTFSRSEDGTAQGVFHLDRERNPEYNAERGNNDPAYNIEFGGYRLRNNFEHTQDWKMAVSQYYGRDGQDRSTQAMALVGARPWEGVSAGAVTPMQGTSPHQGGQRA